MGVPAHSTPSDRLTSLARLELVNIQRRAKAIGGGAMNEQAWAMLLDLFLARQAGMKVQTTYLIEQAGMTHATGLRYIAYLADLRLLIRLMSETDKRSRYVELTPIGRSMLEKYLAESLADLERNFLD